jgi:hypothetical protein
MSERDEMVEAIVRQLVAETNAARDQMEEEVAIAAACARLRAREDSGEGVPTAYHLRCGWCPTDDAALTPETPSQGDDE